MGLVFEPTVKRFFLLTEVVAGTSLHIDKDSGKTDPLEVGAMFSVEGFAAGSNEPLYPGALELPER